MADNNREAPVSTLGWIGLTILLAIPIVNIIVILVEAFGSNSNRNKQTYCRAILIMAIFGAILGGSLFYTCRDVLNRIGSNMDNYIENTSSNDSATESDSDKPLLNRIIKKSAKLPENADSDTAE